MPSRAGARWRRRRGCRTGSGAPTAWIAARRPAELGLDGGHVARGRSRGHRASPASVLGGGLVVGCGASPGRRLGLPAVGHAPPRRTATTAVGRRRCRRSRVGQRVGCARAACRPRRAPGSRSRPGITQPNRCARLLATYAGSLQRCFSRSSRSMSLCELAIWARRLADLAALLEVGPQLRGVGDHQHREHQHQDHRPAGEPRPRRGRRPAAPRRAPTCRGRRRTLVAGRARPGVARRPARARGCRRSVASVASALVPREGTGARRSGRRRRAPPRSGAAGCTSRPARSGPGHRS